MDFLRLPYIFHHKLAGYIDGMDVYTRFRFSRSCSEDGQRLVASCNLRPAVRNRYLPKEYCLSVKPEEPTSA
ncbi:unnamed protein product, partial [Mesorhabditis spiculigera]